MRFGQSQQGSRQIQAHLDTESEIMAISEAQWRRDVRNHLQDFKIYQAIEWIDRSFIT
ncbi:hypothetical protein [Marinobacter gelidimuriae]|uniref:hypothetical protein n=1 Tax=Marinobacter gelidimuriae TaxID=2739064 RepID=UPI0003A6B672